MRKGLSERTARGVAVVATTVNVVAVGGYAITLGDQLRYWDEETYVAIAAHVADGDGYTQFGAGPTAYRPPGYPLLLAGLRLVGMDVVGYRLLNVLLLGATVYLSYVLGRRIFGPTAGAVAAVVVACYPLLTYTAGTLYPQTLAAFCLVAGLVTAGATVGASRWRRRLLAAGSGLIWGLLVLSVPTFGVTFALVTLWLLRQRRRIGLTTIAVVVLTAALLPSAWCLRNAVVMHAFIPVSTNNGINLLQGNSTNATTGGGRRVDTSQYERPAEEAGLSEVEVDRLYRAEAVRWIRNHPGEAARLYFGKVLNHFTYHSDLATSGQNSRVKDLVAAASFYPLLLLTLWRVVQCLRGRGRPMEVLLLSIIFGNALLLAVFYTRLRFRIPIDTLVVVTAAGAFVELAARWTGGLPEPFHPPGPDPDGSVRPGSDSVSS